MRPLTEDETSLVFAKLASFIGDNVSMLIDRNDGDYCFRNHKVKFFHIIRFLIHNVFRNAFTTAQRT